MNWNGGEFTIPCLESILGGHESPDEVVVVDNASTDGSSESIADRFPGLHMIRNKSNIGFGGANNQGIDYLLGKGAEYIWLLNNDTLVAANCMTVLKSAAGRDPDGAGYSARIFCDDPPDRLWYAGAYRHRIHKGVKHTLDESIGKDGNAESVVVPFISGCCMFVPAWAWRRYGGLVLEYVAYSEDSDWCWRVQKAGGKLYYVPGATMWHKVSGSVRKNAGGLEAREIAPGTWYLMMRNHMWTIRRQAEGASKWVALTASCAIALRNAVTWTIHGRRKTSVACIKGLLDGMCRRTPRERPWQSAQ